jgi:hypothetical protein
MRDEDAPAVLLPLGKKAGRGSRNDVHPSRVMLNQHAYVAD